MASSFPAGLQTVTVRCAWACSSADSHGLGRQQWQQESVQGVYGLVLPLVLSAQQVHRDTCDILPSLVFVLGWFSTIKTESKV